MRDHPLVPVSTVIAYFVLIFAGQYAMRDRPAWNWRKCMALWNLSLSLFSWVGMFRTLPQLVHNLYHMSVRDNLCLDPRSTFGSGSTGLWVQLFILSKFPWVYLFFSVWCLDQENDLLISAFLASSLIHFSSWSTKSHLFSFTGTITLLYSSTAGILMSQRRLPEFSLS